MKHLFVILLTLAVLFGCAESDQSHDTAVMSSDQRKSQIRELFNINDEDAFWEIYAAYEKEMSDIQQEHAELASKFSEQYKQGSVNEQQAINILAQYFRIESKPLQVKQKYSKLFQEVLPIEDVIRLFQLDHQ